MSSAATRLRHDASGNGPILLCADDYAMTEGVSRGIEELAAAGRLSATSAMTTVHHWPAHAPRIAEYRPHLAIGLHLNLTLGAPLGSMPGLAPDGRLPQVGALVRRALTGAVDPREIEAETDLQLDAFERALGHPPDYLDGHQHVHALPRVRDGVLAALGHRFRDRPFLVRDPADRWRSIVSRGVAVTKAIVLSSLAVGFAASARRAGFITNDGFAGVSAFEPDTAGNEFQRFALAGGRLPLVMCHPGYADAELASLDPLTTRRERELALLREQSPFALRLLRPQRSGADCMINWDAAWEATA